MTYHVVFLTDSKAHAKPETPVKEEEAPEVDPAPVTETAPEPEEIAAALDRIAPATAYKKPERTEFDDMRDSLKAGIKTVSAPQLFPTPPEIAAHMVELAEIVSGQDILEPSAGTGNIIMAIGESMANGTSGRAAISAVEINHNLCDRLINMDGLGRDNVLCSDFLEIEPAKEGNAGLIIKTLPHAYYDRIIMNPPFENGADIKHIRHALKFLKSDGVLVALCANGPRQREAFMDMADYWEDLPAGSFENQGTGVNVALMVIRHEVAA
jgi:protein-L-isoaspartate O-methyltransferase